MAGGSCCKKLSAIVGLLKAILSRILFVVHGLICIWRLFVVKQEPLYWCMVLTLILIILEMVVTLRVKNGAELGWFSPTVFLYLAYTVPPIWLLELDLLKRRIEHRYTKGYILTKDKQNVAYLPGKIRIPFSLDPEKWVRILQQVLLLLLIIGRWLLPKGKISREQLSQLLLIYIGMAADIIELFEAFKETAVMYSWDLTIVILSLWTASLLQFTFVVSTARARRPSPVYVEEGSINSDQNATSAQRHGRGENDSREGPVSTGRPRRNCCSPSGRCCCCCCCSAESVSILTSITLQDGPFLVLRMLLIFRYNVLSYTNIFFTSKNTLVILLQVYRLAILYCQRVNKKKEKRKEENEERKHKRKDVVVNAAEEMTCSSETDNGHENTKSERNGRSERKSNGCCCGCRDKYDEDDFDRYQEEKEEGGGEGEEEDEGGEEEEEEEEEIVIDEEYMSEEFSESEIEIVTYPSFEDSQLRGSISSSPSTELSPLNLTKGQHTNKNKRCIGHRAEDGAHSEPERHRRLQHNHPIRKGKKNIEGTFKSKQRIPTALHLQQKNIPWETNQKKKGRMKTEEEEMIEKDVPFMKACEETLQVNHEVEPLNKHCESLTFKKDPISTTLGKDPKYSTLRKDPKPSTFEKDTKFATLGKDSKFATLGKDPKSKRPKLFDVAVKARMQDGRCGEELTDGGGLKFDSKETGPLRTTTRCPNCSTLTSKSGRQNGHKRRWSPEGFVVKQN